MVDGLYYEKNQLLLDTEGTVWVLIDIIESKSLLSKSSRPSLFAFIKKHNPDRKEKPKILKVSFKKFSEDYSPFLHLDKNTVTKILNLEKLFKNSYLEDYPV